MMGDVEITVGSRSYDGVQPIVRGEVAVPGLTIAVRQENDTPRLFKLLMDGQVDAGEMSLAELVYYASRDAAAFVGIPVFPSRVFRHGFLFCRPGVRPDALR